MLKISIIQIFDALEYTFHGNKWNLVTFGVLKRVAGAVTELGCRGMGVDLGMTVNLGHIKV